MPLTTRVPGLTLVLATLAACASPAPSPAPTPPPPALPAALTEWLTPLETKADLQPLLDQARGRTLVLLGEPSHGTHEAHAWRAAITRELILRGEISFLALEADWVPLRLLDRYVRGLSGASTSLQEALDAFESWPSWLWRHPGFVSFIEWLRAENLGRPMAERVTLAGIDLNDPWGTAHALLDRLEHERSPHLDEAREALACLHGAPPDPAAYVAAVLNGAPSCLEETQSLAGTLKGGRGAPGEKARVVAAGLEHFLLLAEPGPDGWNRRADHMAESLLELHAERARAGIMWAHNTHVGDARASVMARYGEVSPGQRMRERFGMEEVLLVGFAGHGGEVRAAPAWGAADRVVPIPPAPEESLDHFLGGGPPGDFILTGWGPDRFPPELERERLHRGVGVVYDPERTPPEELWLPVVPGRRFDAIVFLRQTTALEPLLR